MGILFDIVCHATMLWEKHKNYALKCADHREHCQLLGILRNKRAVGGNTNTINPAAVVLCDWCTIAGQLIDGLTMD